MAELPHGCVIRHMQPNDVTRVIAIIDQHDDDDAAWAQQTYSESLDGHFVMTMRDEVVGVTGGTPIEGADRAYNVSWTYLDKKLIGQGYGRALIEHLMEYLRSLGARKVFVSTSDYMDNGRDVYRDAREAYRAAGFQEELRHANYYALGESMIVYGMRLEPTGPASTEKNHNKIVLTDIDEIPECDGAYWLAWELDAEGTDMAKAHMIIDQVKDWDGRVIFLAFPSDVSEAYEFARNARFREGGRLLDYYEDGVDEIHYRLDLI